ncbi:unnamed protein product [Lasius platythorax]|uniref:Uncharacterized protein n=1 Tax=Lasius platythorax TaxID=488582 RepID=A0AAV2P0L6_9HYME
MATRITTSSNATIYDRPKVSRSGKERRATLSRRGRIKGPVNYARFVAFYSGPGKDRVSGQAPGFNPGSVITNFWVRMMARPGLGHVSVRAVLLPSTPESRDDDGCAGEEDGIVLSAKLHVC